MEALRNSISFRISQVPFVKKRVLFFLLTCLSSHISKAQFLLTDSITYQPKKLTTLGISAGVVYGVSMFALNEAWYKENQRQDFHFFNDAAEWKQVDKAGHFYTAFYLSALSAQSINQCGVKAKKSALLGSLAGFVVLSSIEVFDGYSEAYGASASDLIANAGGSVFYWWQQNHWHELRLQPKFSFHRTSFAPLRPAVLGENIPTEILKDYNGQTYWLSADMDKFMRFPKWLNLAVGYGAHSMLYARDATNTANGYDPYRQYYLSVDFDLSAIETDSKFVKGLIKALSLIKLPAPALEMSKRGLKFHPLYF